MCPSERPDAVEIITPLKESQPRVPKPIADDIFYYSQYDVMKSLSQGASWIFTEIRPDAMIGFMPGTNVMNIAQVLGFISDFTGKFAEPAPEFRIQVPSMATDTNIPIRSRISPPRWRSSRLSTPRNAALARPSISSTATW